MVPPGPRQSPGHEGLFYCQIQWKLFSLSARALPHKEVVANKVVVIVNTQDSRVLLLIFNFGPSIYQLDGVNQVIQLCCHSFFWFHCGINHSPGLPWWLSGKEDLPAMQETWMRWEEMWIGKLLEYMTVIFRRSTKATPNSTYFFFPIFWHWIQKSLLDFIKIISFG